MRRGRTCAAAALVIVLLVVDARPAAAIDPARAEYRQQAELICKRNASANRRVLRGVRSRVRRGMLRPAGRQFLGAAGALRRALSELRKVPRPEADAETLAGWLQRVARQATLLRGAGRALIAGKRRRAGRLVTKLSKGARRANALVVAFEFRHCRLEASRYT